MKDTVKYVVERILFILLTAFIILSLTYILLQCLPLEPSGNDAVQQFTFWNHQVELGFYYEVSEKDYFQMTIEAREKLKTVVLLLQEQQ